MVRPYEATDAERVAELLGLVFDLWPRSTPGVDPTEHLRWKLSPAVSDPLTQVVAVAGDDVVATQLRFVQPVAVHGRIARSYGGVDVAVHPHWRGHGLFSAVRHFRAAERDAAFDVHLGITDHAAVKHVRHAEGMRPVGNPIEALRKPLSPWRAVAGRPGPLGVPGRAARALALTARAAVDRARRGGPAAETSGVEVRSVDGFDARFDALWGRVADAFDFAVVRDAARLRWRYGDPRGGPARVLTADDGGELAGYAVLREREASVSIIDLLVAPGRDDVLAALIRRTVQLARADGAATVECFLPQLHPYRAALRRAGFLRTRQRLGLAYRPLAMDAEALAFLSQQDARLHFTLGDTDLG